MGNNMNQVFAWLLIGVATLLVSISVACHRRSGIEAIRAAKLSGPPCRDGFVSVEPLPDVPIRLTILEAVCATPHEAKVRFIAENTGNVAINKFEIGGIDSYDREVTGRKGVNVLGILKPHESMTDKVESGLLGDGDAAVMTSYQLTVFSITYDDGRTWSHAAPKPQPPYLRTPSNGRGSTASTRTRASRITAPRS